MVVVKMILCMGPGVIAFGKQNIIDDEEVIPWRIVYLLLSSPSSL